MKIILDSRKSIHANAAEYFEKSKHLREKLERVKAAISDVEQRISLLDKKQSLAASDAIGKIVVKKVVKKEWYEKFHFFFTTGGLLCIAGKEAKQNEVLVAKHFDENDLFYHADVQGAAATILKGGAKPGVLEQDLREVAQFAASFSRAWKGGFSSVDVYAVKREQVSKSAQSGEYVGKGGFIIRGERKWFKNTELKVSVGRSEQGKLFVVPSVAVQGKAGFVEIAPGLEKKQYCKLVAESFSLSKQEIETLIPLLP